LAGSTAVRELAVFAALSAWCRPSRWSREWFLSLLFRGVIISLHETRKIRRKHEIHEVFARAYDCAFCNRKRFECSDCPVSWHWLVSLVQRTGTGRVHWGRHE